MGISSETTHEFQMWKKLDFRFRPIIQSTNDLHVVSYKNSTNSHCNNAMIFLIYFAPTATVFESPEPRVLKSVYYNALLFDLLHAGVAVFRYLT